MIYTLVGSLLMLVSIITLGHRARAASTSTQIGPSGSTWLFLAFMVAFAIKAPLYPFHGWVPAAYRQSPPEVAALLSGVVSKAGTYGMLRFALPIFPGPAADWRVLLIVARPRRTALVLARRLPPARLARRHCVLVDRPDEPDRARDLRPQRPGRRPARRSRWSTTACSRRCSSCSPGFVEVRFGTEPLHPGRRARPRPARARDDLHHDRRRRRSPFPGRTCSPPSSWSCWAPSAQIWLIGTLAALAIVLAAMYMLRWISAVLHDRPGATRAALTDDRGRAVLGDVRWEAVYLVPLVAAVLALSAYPYFVTHRVTLVRARADRPGGPRGR